MTDKKESKEVELRIRYEKKQGWFFTKWISRERYFGKFLEENGGLRELSCWSQ